MCAKKKHITWGGRFKEGPSALMQQFSESVSFDARLAPYDIACSKAHASMLAKSGLILKKERDAIRKGLDQILKTIESGGFKWDTALEDVHMNIEHALTKRVPAAAKLHTARSRNDQVATDMRLFFKDACTQLVDTLTNVCHVIIAFAEQEQATIIPGYTHLQRAQPVSVAHHVLAYVTMFRRDQDRLKGVFDRANWCPLGSGAIAGSTLPIDREHVALELGFTDSKGRAQLTHNSMDAVSDRDLFMDFTHACAVCAAHFSRLAEDIILWNSSEFAFIKLPDTFTTGSSLMPQKKNPDSMELVRGKAARIMGHSTTLLTMVKGLPLTYNRDLQEDKPPVFDAYEQTMICLEVVAGTIEGAQMNTAACEQAVSDPALLATDLVDHLVLKGVPFRDAHHIIGSLIGMAEKQQCSLPELSDSDAQSVCSELRGDWRKVFDIHRALNMRDKVGMPGPKQIKQEIKRHRKELASISLK